MTERRFHPSRHIPVFHSSQAKVIISSSWSSFPFIPSSQSDPWSVHTLVQHLCTLLSSTSLTAPSSPSSLAYPPSSIYVSVVVIFFCLPVDDSKAVNPPRCLLDLVFRMKPSPYPTPCMCLTTWKGTLHTPRHNSISRPWLSRCAQHQRESCSEA